MSEKNENLYTFTHNGKSYTFEKPVSEVATPKWLRANRRRSEVDQTFTALEEIAGDEVLEVIDSMTRDEFVAFSKKFEKELSAAFQ